jgi:hypothetical protein
MIFQSSKNFDLTQRKMITTVNCPKVSDRARENQASFRGIHPSGMIQRLLR